MCTSYIYNYKAKNTSTSTQDKKNNLLHIFLMIYKCTSTSYNLEKVLHTKAVFNKKYQSMDYLINIK